MKVEDVQQDGTIIWQYESGDIVKIIDSDVENWLIKKGEKAVIKGHSEIIENAYELSTKAMRDNGWGTTDLVPEQFEPYGLTKLQMPQKLKLWKREQIKKLVGVNECLEKMNNGSPAKLIS